MSKIKLAKSKTQRQGQNPGSSPGLIELSESALKPQISVHSYNDKDYSVTEIEDPNALNAHLDEHPDLLHWIDIRGLGDIKIFEFLEQRFHIHKLVLEDISNTFQRPKLDEYEGYLFSTSRMIYIDEGSEIENEQVSFILMDKVLISFQENYHLCINPVINRLKGGKGTIRTAGTSYMMYTIMDVIIDNYFALIYKMGDELDIIEELLYRKPDKKIMYKIQEIKRIMILIRRAAWPERDKINDLIRSDSPLITAETKTFLKDVYDHCMQVVDLVESYKDVTTTLIDMNLSIISNRMNEIMKVLTIISSIFIPLTFIAGVYGMNFAYEDPVTHKVLRQNMPELYAEHGYLYTWIAMLFIAVLQIIYFWKRGWFKSL